MLIRHRSKFSHHGCHSDLSIRRGRRAVRHGELARFQTRALAQSLQDGTLTDSIAAVEAAWTAKANELGLEPEAVIKATHGRRASDNLMELVPGLKKQHVDKEVESASLLGRSGSPPADYTQSLRNPFSSLPTAPKAPLPPLDEVPNHRLVGRALRLSTEHRRAPRLVHSLLCPPWLR